ncbi:hypothetical protein ACWGJ2_10835 [Streptomyces sp. NPDC054796]
MPTWNLDARTVSLWTVAGRLKGILFVCSPQALKLLASRNFTDRDGKYQLGTLKESAFDPLSRTCEFMLKEEAHHMFVGTTGIDRVVTRSAQLIREDDHLLADGAAVLETPGEDGGWERTEVPALLALNLDLRDAYTADCRSGVARWNRVLDDHGIGFRFTLPHPCFNRRVGLAAGRHVTPDGRIVDEAEWERNRRAWLPTPEDLAFVKSLMRPVREPGRIAGWIAPPSRGINGRPLDYAYVHLP